MEILKNIHTHDTNYGAHFVEVTAGTGKGKTAMLLSVALYNLDHFKQEKVFFCECFDTTLQSLKLGKERVLFLFPEKEKNLFKFKNRDKRLEETPFEFFNVAYYKDFKDLYAKAQVDKINVPVFYDRRDIMDFIGWQREVGDFTMTLIDEMSEIATAISSLKGMWKRCEQFAFIAKDLRKSFVNVWYTAQNTRQTDWRVRAAVDIKVFGPSSRIDSNSIVWQEAVHGLNVDKEHGNEFYIVDGGSFGLFRLVDIFEPKEGLNFGIYRERKAD